MKSLLLFVLSLTLGVAVIAQQAPVKEKHLTTMAPKSKVIESPSLKAGFNLPARTTKSASDVSKVLIGSSVNIYGSGSPEQVAIDFSADANLLMSNYRGDPVTPGYLTGNDVVLGYSDDLGASWQEKKGFQGSSSDRCRYPAGVIFNPAGNTSIGGTYSAVAGPITNGSNWVKAFMGSRLFDGTNVNEQKPAVANESMYNNGATVTSDGIFIVGETYTASNDHTDATMDYYRGVFNGTTNMFDYTFESIDMKPHVVEATDGTFNCLGYFGSAFNQDGSVGYMWTFGADVRDPEGSGMVPIVFQSLNGGETWDILPFQDFGDFTIMENYIIPTAKDNLIKPCFKYSNDDYYYMDADGVVDAEGNLHLFSAVTSTYSVDKDSAFYSWNVGGFPELANLFAFEYVKDAEVWMAWYVDSLLTRPVLASQSYLTSSSGNYTWSHRLQASMNPSEDKVFFVWTDTKPEDWGLEEPYANLYPDVKVWGRDLATNLNTPAMNMTQLQEGYGECLMMFASPHAIGGEGYTEIPVRIDDLATNGFDADAPVFHYYLKGIQITDDSFTILANKNIDKSGASISEVYPNPFRNETNVDVALAKTGNVTIEISTLTGQNVYNQDLGSMAAGKHSIIVKPASKLSSGVYVMTVTVGQERFTNKVIVK